MPGGIDEHGPFWSSTTFAAPCGIKRTSDKCAKLNRNDDNVVFVTVTGARIGIVQPYDVNSG